MGLFDIFRSKPDQPDAPEPAAPVPAGNLLRAWTMLRKIPLAQLFPAVTSVSVVVFFALSGVVAWVVVLLAFAVKLFGIVS